MSTTLTTEIRSMYQFCGLKDRARRIHERDGPSNNRKLLSDQGCTGQFNSPYAPHLGGVWERQIGKIRRILAAMLLETKGQKLTHELLVILMSAVSAIVNAHHDHSFRFGRTPPTDTFHVANTEDPSSRPSLRKVYVSRSVCSKEVERQADQFWSRWRGEYL